MPRKKSYLTATDMFCGAGGSSQGVRNVGKKTGGGIEVTMAMNHWRLAIDTHNTNFPDTDHDCADVSNSDPRRYPSTDILIGSPECRTHTPAGGNTHRAFKKQLDLFDKGKIDPSTERSRATMWDIVRFAEYHNYRAIVVENVIEAKTRWQLFDTWLMAMHNLGYNHRCVYLNSMHFFPTPQSRDRMYIVFWKKGQPAPMLDYTPIAYCGKCENNVQSVQTWKRSDRQYGKYRQQYVYCCPVCASVVEPYYFASLNCIDWTDIGQRIGDRKKPLSPNTTKRINYGIDKHAGSPSLSSFLVNTLNGKNDHTRNRSVFDTGFTQTTYNGQMLVNPFIIKNEHSNAVDMTRSASEALQTQCTRQTFSLVVHPFLIGNYSPGWAKSATQPFGTITCNDHHGVLNAPFLVEMHSKGRARSVSSELNTITAGAVKTGIVTTDAWNSFVAAYHNGSSITRHYTEALPTQTTNDANALVTYKKPNIDDCYYRMLKPGEVKLGMAFDHDYVILGNSREQVKQCGNAVTPPAMEWLITQIYNSLK